MSPNIVILGSMKKWGKYKVLSPHPIDSKLYQTDHEAAYKLAQAVFYPAIEEADVVLVYAPDGVIDGHTKQDVDYTIGIGKTPIMIRDLQQLQAVNAVLDEHCRGCGIADGKPSCDHRHWREKAVDPGDHCIFRRLRHAAGQKIVITYMDGSIEEWKPTPGNRWLL